MTPRRAAFSETDIRQILRRAREDGADKVQMTVEEQKIEFTLDRAGKPEPQRRLPILPPDPFERLGWVYFVSTRLPNLIKIGFSKEPDARLCALSQQSPVDMRLVTACPGTLRDERAMHRRFHHLRERGEWFRCDYDLASLVNDHLDLWGSSPWTKHWKRGDPVG